MLLGILLVLGLLAYFIVANASDESTSSSDEAQAPTSTPSPSTEATVRASASATPSPAEPAVREFQCTSTDASGSQTLSGLAQVWAAGETVRSCKVTGLTKGSFTPAEQGALDIFQSPPSAQSSASPAELLGYIYDTCIRQDGPYTAHVQAGQINEPRAALVLCPDAPHAPALQAAIDAQTELQETKEADAAEISSGTAFPTGSYRVGVEGGIPAGTYVSESDAAYLSCYWERLDSSGEIIDNNFATDVYRLEVTIESTDFSFKTDGCGTWRLAP